MGIQYEIEWILFMATERICRISSINKIIMDMNKLKYSSKTVKT